MIQRSKQEVAGLQGAAPLRGSLRAERARGHCGLAATITIGLLTIALAISFGYAPADLLVQGLLNPFHVVYFGIVDSRGQRLAHYVLLGGLLVAVILFRRCRKATEWVQSHWADSMWVRASIMKALVAFGLLSWPRRGRRSSTR